MGFQDLLERFIDLGGIAENICQKDGDYGRGIFPLDSSRRVKIMTPKHLLVSTSDLWLDGNKIAIKNGRGYKTEEIVFLEWYYNNYSWGNNGNADSIAFLKFTMSLPDSIKKQLVSNGFIGTNVSRSFESCDCILKRFISERRINYKGQRVLAPVWEFVNHSSFSPTIRITSYGIETPPIEPSSGEVLHQYSGKNSPIGIWSKYGFACDCIVAYSIPFNINLEIYSLAIRCSGKLGLGPEEKKNISIIGNILTMKIMPIGCVYFALPYEIFKSTLSSVGLSADIANRLFSKICEMNLNARYDLIDSLQEQGTGAKAQLYTALIHEIKLIKNSLI